MPCNGAPCASTQGMFGSCATGEGRTSPRSCLSRTARSTPHRSTDWRHCAIDTVGETAVIVGNGPSLNDTELEILTDVPTFGVNAIFLGR